MPNSAPVLNGKIIVFLVLSNVIGAATIGFRGVAWAFHVRDGIRGLVMVDENNQQTSKPWLFMCFM